MVTTPTVSPLLPNFPLEPQNFLVTLFVPPPVTPGDILVGLRVFDQATDEAQETQPQDHRSSANGVHQGEDPIREEADRGVRDAGGASSDRNPFLLFFLLFSFPFRLLF